MEPEVLLGRQVGVQRGVLEDQADVAANVVLLGARVVAGHLRVPEVALASVQRILIVVVLPAPFGPRKPNVSPTVTSKSIPRTASTSP